MNIFLKIIVGLASGAACGGAGGAVVYGAVTFFQSPPVIAVLLMSAWGAITGSVVGAVIGCIVGGLANSWRSGAALGVAVGSIVAAFFFFFGVGEGVKLIGVMYLPLTAVVGGLAALTASWAVSSRMR